MCECDAMQIGVHVKKEELRCHHIAGAGQACAGVLSLQAERRTVSRAIPGHGQGRTAKVPTYQAWQHRLPTYYLPTCTPY